MRRSRFAAASILLAGGLGFVPSVQAGDVQVAVNLSVDSEDLGHHQLVVAEGKSGEIRLDGKVRLFVNPRVTREGRILLSMRLEEPSGAGWKKIGEPRLLVENGVQAEVSVTSPKGNAYRISIRPQIS